MLQDKAAIIGIGQTAFARRLEASETELACDAILRALRDAGLQPDDVDGLASYTMESTPEQELAKNLGMRDIRWFGQVGHGGGAGPGIIGQLAMAIACGQCQVGVAWRARKRGSGKRLWSDQAASAQLTTAANWARPWGVIRPVDEIALLASHYMHTYGISRDHLANVALACRRHANNNPDASMYDRALTREQYMQSRWVSRPLCLYDNCLESDGAVAVVMVAADRARDCPGPPVYIHAFAQGIGSQTHSMVNYFSDDPLAGDASACAAALYARSDFQAADIDVAQLYDSFTPLVLLALESYGFCGRGEAGKFSECGNLELGGQLPINTAGGGLSEAYIHGFNLITEGVRQLRGTSRNQVKNARSCLVTGGSSVPTSAVILRSDP